MESIVVYIDYIKSPVGLMEVKASVKGVTQLIFCGSKMVDVKTNDITDCCKQQLTEYFESKRKIFNVPLDPQGTDFQKLVWGCLVNISFGETCSYLDIAKMVNKPKGAQAVGGANGRNPISIIVPCHRVIGSNGSLTGYAGGVERKLWLLEHEGIVMSSIKGSDEFDLDNVIHTRQSKTQFLK